MGQRAKSRLFIVILVLLFLPLLEQNLKFIESGPLNGDVTGAPDEPFSLEKWWDGSYQQKKNLHLNDSVGFRPDLVRFNNQWEYSFFKKLYARSVVLGKHHVLFEQPYITEYFNESAENEKIAREKLTRFKRIQDTLEHLGKTVVFVYAPSKAYMFADDLPDENGRKPGAKTMYHSFRRIGDSLGIHQIDGNGWFIEKEKKDGKSSMLMSKQGTHWTYFGALVMEDSIIKYIEKARNITMPQMVWGKEEMGKPWHQEDDEIKGLNLIFPIEPELYRRPFITYQSPHNAVKPRIAFLGDSFLWTFIYTHFMENCSDGWEFWYYFNEVWDAKAINGQGGVHKGDFDWQKSLLDKDCLVILYTEPNLYKFGDGFVEKAYDYFYPSGK